MSAPQHPTLRALALPDLRAFLVARFLGTLSQSLLHASIAWHVFDRTHSYFALGLLGVIEFVPVIPVSLLGGAIADSWDRRAVVLTARAALLLGACVLAAGTGNVDPELGLILVIALALATARGFGNPASSALLPAIVPRELYPSAVVTTGSVRNLAFVSGPLLAGFSIEAAGVRSAYALAAGLLLLSLGALLGVRRVAPGEASEVSLAAVRQGIAFVRRHPAILSAMTLDMFAVIFASVTALLPVFADEILAVGPRGYGLLGAAMSIGTFSMTGILLLRRPIQRPGRALLLAVLCFGTATLAFGFSRSFPLSVAALVLAGMADQVSMVTRATIINLSTPDGLRGRVNSVNFVFIGASNELGAAESGFLAALTSAVFSVVAGGIACLAVAGIVAWRVPALRRHLLDNKDSTLE